MHTVKQDRNKLHETVDIMESTTLAKEAAASAGSTFRKEFSDWIVSIKNVNLAAKAKELWQYLNDRQVPVTDKAIIVAALLYCVAPIDIVPDHIPLAGLLDDLSVVLRVLAYISVDDKIGKQQSKRSTVFGAPS